MKMWVLAAFLVYVGANLALWMYVRGQAQLFFIALPLGALFFAGLFRFLGPTRSVRSPAPAEPPRFAEGAKSPGRAG